MKRALLWVLFAAAIVVLGSACGGGGGSGGGTASATATSGSTGYIDDQIVGALANGSGEGVNLSDLAVGDQVQLTVAARTTTGQYVTLAGSNWATTAPASVASVSSSGLLTVSGASSNTYTVTVTDPNGPVTANLIASAPKAFVTGLVRDVNDVGIPDVLVQFYSSAGDFLTEATTSTNGTFRGNVPTNATKFTINIEQADPPINGVTIFYRDFDYGPLSYLDGNTSCLTTLPQTTVGTTTQLPNAIVLDAENAGPPPPPTGCATG